MNAWAGCWRGAGGPGDDLDNDGERGSVLLLTVGLAVVALLVVAVVTDAAALFLHRRSLAAAADGAALAGAQGVDLAAVYAGRADGTLPLTSKAVRSRVRAYVSASAPDAARVLVARTDGTRVRVRLGETVRLPFRSWLPVGDTSVEVVAEAVAETPLR